MHIRHVVAWSLIALLLIVAGCVESEQEYTINPDLSGKVRVIMYVPPRAAAQAPTDIDAATSQQKAMQAAQRLFRGSSGVDAWSSLTYEHKQGDARIEGTALFRDFEKLNLGPAGKFNLSLTRDDQGNIVLKLNEESPEAEQEKPELSEGEIAALVAKHREEYAANRPNLEQALGTLRVTMRFNMPGPVTKATDFKKIDERTVELVIDGAQVLKAYDQLEQKPDSWWAQRVAQAGQSDPPLGNEIMAIVFSAPGEPTAIASTEGAAPQFDFDAELKAAKSNEPAIRQSLGIE